MRAQRGDDRQPRLLRDAIEDGEQQGVAVTRVSRLDDVPSGTETLLVDDTDGIVPAAGWRSLLSRAPRLVVVHPGVVALGVVLLDAREAGATTVFLSAGTDAVARVYERVAFRRFATAGIASVD